MIKPQTVRLVCPKAHKKSLMSHFKQLSGHKDLEFVWHQKPSDSQFAHLGEDTLAFGEIYAQDSEAVACLEKVVFDLIGQGETVGLMGIEDAAQIKALFFDMDATVIREESLILLAERRGLGQEIARITEEAMAGHLDFALALRKRVAMLAGTPLAEVVAIQSELTLQPGIVELVALAKQKGVQSYMVSGGFTVLAGPIAEKVDMAGYQANRFATTEVSGQKVLTGELEGPLVDGTFKRDFLLGTCKDLGLTGSHAVAVGDGANDLLMLGVAAYAVGLKPKEALRSVLHIQNQLGDHRLLSYFLFGL